MALRELESTVTFEKVPTSIIIPEENDTNSEVSSACSENIEMYNINENVKLQLHEETKEWVTGNVSQINPTVMVKIEDLPGEYPLDSFGNNVERMAEPTHVTCVIDLELKPRELCVLCPEKHALSKDHLANMVQYSCSKSVDTILKHEGKINCPVPGCEYHYSHWEVAQNVTEQSFGQYMAMINRVQYQKAFVQIAEDIEEQRMQKIDEQEAQENVIMQEAIRNQFRNTNYENNEYGKSFKCPICAFGPIDKFECDDLQTHHGEVKGDGISISNACPMCGYFAEDVTGWSYWDGTFLQGKRMRDTKKIIDNVGCTFEEEKKIFLEQREQLLIEHKKCAASFHPLAKILDKINPTRYLYYERSRTYEGDLSPLESPSNYSFMYGHMKELESEKEIRNYSASHFHGQLMYSLRKSLCVSSYAQRELLTGVDDKIYVHDSNFTTLSRKMCDQIAADLKEKDYENPVVWAFYDDEEESY